MDRFIDVARVESALPFGVRRERDVAASTLTTWRVGGPVALVVYARSVADVEAVAGAVDPTTPVLTIGRGSNLLVADDGFPGVAIVLGEELETIRPPEPDGPREAHAGGAVALPVLARQLSTDGWGGLEFYVGIPGSVGGAVRMNAGGHGRDTAAVLARARVVSIDRRSTTWLDVDALDMSYRHSAIGARDVVVEAVFHVEADDPRKCLIKVNEVVRWRRENQPGGANAGSVFRNPGDESAGRIVDDAGLKRLRVGGAWVSDKHANFIQTDPGATAKDVVDLIELVQRLVADRTGTRLEPEVHMVGFEHPPAGTQGTRP